MKAVSPWAGLVQEDRLAEPRRPTMRGLLAASPVAEPVQRDLGVLNQLVAANNQFGRRRARARLVGVCSAVYFYRSYPGLSR